MRNFVWFNLKMPQKYLVQCLTLYKCSPKRRESKTLTEILASSKIYRLIRYLRDEAGTKDESVNSILKAISSS